MEITKQAELVFVAYANLLATVRGTPEEDKAWADLVDILFVNAK